MIDIHCHLLPGVDDGPSDWATALEMAQLAVADGTRVIVATPHQLGQFRQNHATTIRGLVKELSDRLSAAHIDLQVVPGADVRIESDLLERIAADEVLTLADRGKHLLLELPHELYFPLEPLLQRLAGVGITGILSHPERNLGIQADPSCLASLIGAGCLMQVTAGSLLGTFGSAAQTLAEQMVRQGLVHFVASDGHGTRTRRPRLMAAYHFISRLSSPALADLVCCDNPQRVLRGEAIVPPAPRPAPRHRTWLERTMGRYGSART